MTENNGDYQSENLYQRIDNIEKNLHQLQNTTQSKSAELGKELFSLQSMFKQVNSQWESNEEFYSSLIHWVGYSLLLLTLSYYISVLIPFRLMNPVWELQTIAAFVDNFPMFLLGVLFAFYGSQGRNRIEKLILKLVSWVALLMGILFLLLLPLGIADTLRINNQNNAQVLNQQTQQAAQIQQIKTALNNANTLPEINRLINAARLQIPATDTSTPQQLKAQAYSQIVQAEQAAKTQIEQSQKEQRLTLFKTGVRYVLGALICGVLSIYAWRITFLINKFVLI